MLSAEMVTNLKTIGEDNYKSCKLDETGVRCESPIYPTTLSLTLSLSLSLSLSDVDAIKWCDGTSWVADRQPVDAIS